MSITPTGSPAWLRSNDFTSYGGNLNKQNYLLRGVVDPYTDLDAAEFARMTADLAALQRVAPFANLIIQMNDTSPAAPTIQRAHMMTGIRTTSYSGSSAPSGFPSAARTSNGVCTVTFASSYTDDYSVSGTFAVQCPIVQYIGGIGSARTVQCSRDSATQLTVKVTDDAGAAVSDPLIALTVWSG